MAAALEAALPFQKDLQKRGVFVLPLPIFGELAGGVNLLLDLHVCHYYITAHSGIVLPRLAHV